MMKNAKPSQKPRSPAGDKAYHHGDLRQALLDAALGLVATEGVRGFTLREAARAAGVSHNAPYRHFASRADILAALALEGQATLLQCLKDGMGQTVNRKLRLEKLSIAYLEFATTHTAFFRVMFSPDVAAVQTPELQAAQKKTFACFVTEVEAAESDGTIRTGKVARFSLAGWSAMHGAAMLLIDRVLDRSPHPPGSQSPRDLARMVMGVLLEGMLARP
ncbi:MAG: TetR/AcrR family transcriptional regulator [Planctomycetota bacterium]|nr:TetR/AcrR family transcriptional regulator [Planctomycetota bacterium]